MLNVFAKILAKNPPSILIVLGVVLHIFKDAWGIPLVLAGIILNVLWLVGRFR